MSTVNVATSYITDKVYVNKIGGMITEEEKIGFTGTKTVAKLKGGRTYNFATKVENAEGGYQYKAVFITKGNGNLLSREFVADGKEQSFSITLGEDEHTIYINNSEGVKVVVSYEQEADFDPKPADFKTPQPFRFWCQTVLPLVYDDSLSYYELLSKVVNYLNSLINDVTNVENIYTNLTNAYTELEGYVNSYFDNLDVSEAIDAKLDEMVLHGDFDALVEDALSHINYTGIINARVDEDLPDVVDNKLGAEVAEQIGAVVEAQIDDVVEEQIGGAVASQIGDVVEEQLGDEVSAQLPDEVETLIGPAVALQIGDAVGDKIGNEVRSQIGGVVADQISDVVEEQIGDVVEEDITAPVENWLARNFVNPPVDKSLSIDNAAADAKVTGDAIRELQTLTIQGYTKKETDIELVRFTDTMITEENNRLYYFPKNGFNCAMNNNISGGTQYKVTLDYRVYGEHGAERGAGWLVRNLAIPVDPDQSFHPLPPSIVIVGELEDYIGTEPNGTYTFTAPFNADGIVINSANTTLISLEQVGMDFEKSEDVVAPAEIETFQNQSLIPDEILWNSDFDANGDVETNSYMCVVKYVLPEIEGDSQVINIDLTGVRSAIAIETRDDNGIIRTYNFMSTQGTFYYRGSITVPANAKYLWITTALNPYGCVKKEGYNGYIWKGFESIVEEPNVANRDENFKIVILYDTPTQILAGWLYLVVDPSTHKVTDIYCGEA